MAAIASDATPTTIPAITPGERRACDEDGVIDAAPVAPGIKDALVLVAELDNVGASLVVLPPVPDVELALEDAMKDEDGDGVGGTCVMPNMLEAWLARSE